MKICYDSDDLYVHTAGRINHQCQDAQEMGRARMEKDCGEREERKRNQSGSRSTV